MSEVLETWGGDDDRKDQMWLPETVVRLLN